MNDLKYGAAHGEVENNALNEHEVSETYGPRQAMWFLSNRLAKAQDGLTADGTTGLSYILALIAESIGPEDAETAAA